MKLSTLKMTLPELAVSQLKKYLNNLVVILPPLAEMNALLLQGRSDDAAALIEQLKSLGIDKGALKIGVDYHSSDSLIDMLGKLAADEQVPLVADSPVDYIDATDYFPMQVLKNIAAGTKIANVAELSKQVGPYWLRPADQVEAEYRQIHLTDSITQVDNIVAACNVEIKNNSPSCLNLIRQTGLIRVPIFVNFVKRGWLIA